MTQCTTHWGRGGGGGGGGGHERTTVPNWGDHFTMLRGRAKFIGSDDLCAALKFFNAQTTILSYIVHTILQSEPLSLKLRQ